MTVLPNDNYERLLLSFDQLGHAEAFIRSNWLETSAALKNIAKLLSQITFGSESGSAVPFADIRCPDATEPLYSWFLELQESFQGNIASQLLQFLSRLDTLQHEQVEEDERAQLEQWTTLSLYLLQGCLLLHSASKSLFSRAPNMALLCTHMGAEFPEAVQMDAIQTVVAALVDKPANFRVFERIGGLECISSLFKSPDTVHKVKVKILEFLYFYLMPEAPDHFSRPSLNGETPIASSRTALYYGDDTIRAPKKDNSCSDADKVRLQKHVREAARDGNDTDVENASLDNGQRATRAELVRSTSEKQIMLGKYFSNIDALVKDLDEFKPFGEF